MIQANKQLFVAVACSILLVLFAVWNEFRHEREWEVVKEQRGCQITSTVPARDLIYYDDRGRHVRVVPEKIVWTCLDGTEWIR